MQPTDPPHAPLPRYAAAPVVEVALTVQFANPGIPAPDLFRFWERIKDSFPIIEEQQPLPPIFEEFDPKGPPKLTLQFADRPPSPRYWFVSDDGRSLVQVQSDRFAYNWRKRDDNDQYPFFDQVSRIFHGLYVEFHDSLSNRQLSPEWCEIVYFNHITPNQYWSQHGELHKILRSVTSIAHDSERLNEDTRLVQRFRYLDSEGIPKGRLTVEAAPAFTVEGDKPVYTLSLSARGKIGGTESDVMDFMMTGRDWIVRTFTDITTDEMHLVWRRER